MAANLKSSPLKGVHTAGIFADMTIDGPVIGTLVLVVDRAKNLPNRKTIGKQDPYCAARLGKEAKKTNTDIRGGQTPKWDQELRFKVHDSPDYFQLKVSVFSDDKKTELIGETWIDLRDIIVPGGGQSDQWHSLNCRSKYAGEIRLETTYYDSRPPEKPPVAVATPTVVSSASMSRSARGRQGVDSAAGGSVAFGPRGPAPKRRPLPSDPVTGQPPPAPPQPQHQSQSQPQPRPLSPFLPQPQPLQGPEVARTPPRPQPNPPSAYNTRTPTRPPMPPASYSSTPPHAVLYQQQQPLQQTSVSQVPSGWYPSAQGPDLYAANGPDAGFDNISPAKQYHHSRRQSHHSYQSHSRDRSQYGADEVPPDFTDGANFQDRQLPLYNQQPRDAQEGYYNTGSAPGPTPTSMAPFYDSSSHSAVDDRPPPPPVHRNRNNSSSANAPNAVFRNSHDATSQKGSPLPTMRSDVLRNEVHRHSLSSAYPGRPTYRPIEGNSHAYSETNPDPSLHSSSQPIYDGSGPSLDEISSTAPLNVAGNRGAISASPIPMHNSSTPSQSRYGEANGPTGRTSPPPLVSRDFRRASTSPQPGVGPAPYHAAYDSAVASYRYGSSRTDDAMHAYDSDTTTPMSVPASLVPGMDPSLAMEDRSRTHHEERYSGHRQQAERPGMRHSMPPQSMTGIPAQATPPSGRQLPGGEAWTGYKQDGSPQAYTSQRSQTHAAQAYSTPLQTQVQRQPSNQRYDHSPGPHSSGAPSPAENPPGRGSSPNPLHTIKRKSISPAPSPREGDFDVPFGPDSFNSLNPTLAKTLEEQVRPDYNEASGKIVMHDGREVDPSDHLPVETWAPEPEPKPPKAESPAATASPRDYSTPTSGRKQLRIAGRIQSSTASSGITFSSADDANTFTPTSRNRLQKKTNRQNTATIPVSGRTPSATGSPMGSVPRAPLTHSRQQQTNFTPPHPPVRASTFDYPSENHSPAYCGGGSPGRPSNGGRGAAPPPPPKISMNGGSSGADSYGGSGSYRNSIGSSGGGYPNGGDRSPIMSGALPLPASGSPSRVLPWDNGPGIGGENGTSSEMSLVEELSKIDIGTGRARRHHGQYY